MLRVSVGKETNQEITDDDKTYCGQPIPEELHTAMQVALRKYNIPGHDKTRRKAKAECDHVGGHLIRNDEVAIYVNRLLVQYEINCKKLNEYIKYGISTSARQVAKSSGGYDVCKRLMDKINNAYYDASGYF